MNTFICGEKIEKFKVLAIGSVREKALALAEKMSEKLGKNVRTADTYTAGMRIVELDNTLLGYSAGAIEPSRDRLVLRGSYHSLDLVIGHFLSELSENTDFTDDEELDFADTPKIYTKKELEDVLSLVYNSNDMLIIGDEVNNNRRMPHTMLEPFFEATGRYPSIIGMDLGRCGLKLPTLADDMRRLLSQMVCELVEYAAKGGIITIACHFTNPAREMPDWSEDRGHIGGEDAWRELVTEGTETNARFKRELEADADMLAALRDNGVPIIWRPLHELNGGWFWFHPFDDDGALLPAFTIQNLWKYIHNYFTNERGLDNLLWEYSPNNRNDNKPEINYCYPGDEYVDMTGLDWYTDGGYEIDGAGKSYAGLMEHGKVTNIAEFGPQGSLMGETKAAQARLFTAEDVMKIVERMYSEGYKIGYLLTYAGKNSFIWLPKADEVMQSGKVLSLEDMPAVFERVRK